VHISAATINHKNFFITDENTMILSAKVLLFCEMAKIFIKIEVSSG